MEKDCILGHRRKPEHPSEAQQRQQHNRYLHTAPAREEKKKDKHKSLSWFVTCTDERTNRYRKGN